ncbi:MucBP domain-containing protein [Streptococcus suis]|uniref:MucBP domain-containing protein n=1 Tax=Streptococcus suis TaxID=1307 RepID=UPI0037981E50
MKKNKKFVKLGIKLMASTVLVGCAATIQLPFDVLSQNNIIYAEDTNNQPISVLIGAISEVDGPLSQYYVTISPGETKTVTAPEVDGYKLDQYTESTYELTYDYASRLVNSGGTAWVLFWMEKDTVNSETPPKSEEQNNSSEEAPIQFTVSHYETLDDSGSNLKMLDTTTYTLKPGEYVDVAAKEFPGYRLVDGMTARVYYEDIIKLDGPYWEFLYVLDSVEEPTNGNNSTDTNTVNYTIQLVDQDGQVLQTIQQSGVEGTEVTFDFPVISGYRVGKAEGFESGTAGKNGSFRLVANKTVKVYYDKAPSIDSLIRPEQRAEYQQVFDTFHATVLKAFEVYKKELGVDDITYEANDLEKIFADSNLSALHSELVLVKPLFDKPVGLVLTDQDIINAIGWAPEYWDNQISYHKEITQKLEKAMASIAASKAEPTVPVDQPITIKAVYTEEQIEPGQKVDLLKEIEYTIKPGESVVLEPLTFEGWTSRVAQERKTVTYEEAKNRPNKEYYFYYVEDNTALITPPSEKPNGSTVTPPADNSKDSTVTAPKDKEKDSTSNSNISVGGDKQPMDNKKTEQLAVDKKEKAATSATDSKKEEKASSGTKTLPNTGQATSVSEMTGFMMLGLAGLAFAINKRRRNG